MRLAVPLGMRLAVPLGMRLAVSLGMRLMNIHIQSVQSLISILWYIYVTQWLPSAGTSKLKSCSACPPVVVNRTLRECLPTEKSLNWTTMG